MAGTRLYIQTSFSLLLFLIYFSAWIKIKRENNDIFIQSKNTRSHTLTNINYKLIPQRSWLSNIFQVNQYEKRGFERLYKEFTILLEEEGQNHYDGMPISVYFIIIIDDESDKLRTFASDLQGAIEKRNISIDGSNHQHYNTFIEVLDSNSMNDEDIHSVITRMQQKHSSFSEFPIILRYISNNDLVDDKSDDTKIEIDVESGVVILSIIASKNGEEITKPSQKIDFIANILLSGILPQKNFHENRINDLPLLLQPKYLSIQITILHQLPITYSSSSKNNILNVGYLLNDLAHDKFLPMLLENSLLSSSSSDIEISCNVGSISSSSSLFSTSNNKTIIDEMAAYKWFSHDPFLQQQQQRRRNKALSSNVLHFVIIIPSKENNNPIHFSNQIKRRDSYYNASPELGVAYDIPNKGGIYLLNHNNDDTTTMDVEITKALSSFIYMIRESTRSVLPQDVAVKHNRRKETYHDLNIHFTPATKYHSSFFTPWEIKRLYHFLAPIYYKDTLEKFGLLMNLLYKNTSIEITQENIHKIKECLDALKFVKDSMRSKNVTSSSKAKDTTCNVLTKTNNITDSTSASCAPLVHHHQLKHALDSLESLLHDSTLMEAQDTPKEHLFAVLTPFLLPLLLPMFLGFVQEIKRYNDKKKQNKESEEDKQEEQKEKIITEAVEVCPDKKEE